MTIEDRRLFALLPLALLRPFLGDAADGVDQRLGLHDSTRALLPRSVYSTRGQAIWSVSSSGITLAMPFSASLRSIRATSSSEASAFNSTRSPPTRMSISCWVAPCRRLPDMAATIFEGEAELA